MIRPRWQPIASHAIRSRLRYLAAKDVPAHGGRTLAYVYDSGITSADEIGREALAMFAGTNGLDPTAFPSLLTMENDLVGLAGRLLDAPDGFVGSATSGGTESLLLAVLAARDGAPGVDRPNIVLPATAHAAFYKAAHYLGVRAVVVDVDPRTFRADPEAMAAACDDSTVLVVASAPSYAHGVVDPVDEIAAFAAERGIRCHVDACIGGWVLPWLDDTPVWDFSAEGVTSVSVDLHKYAYAPKGISLLLHRDAALRQGHVFAWADWPGYTVVNTTMQSTKSGGPLAGAWAVARRIGEEGYAALALRARDATLDVAAAVDRHPHLRLLAFPDSTLLALTTDDTCDVFTIADEMGARGWYVQPQLSFRGSPASLHLSLSAATARIVPEFLSAFDAAVGAARTAGPVSLDPALAAAASTIDPGSVDDSAFTGLLALAGLATADGTLALPERMAPLNALLDVLPIRLREALLAAYLDRLNRPTG